MAKRTDKTRDHEWTSYYKRFTYFSPQKIRDGCHPRLMEHPSSTKAIVLVHGLTDSPHFVKAIGEYFYNALGYNVYMPLLHCHGLKEPNGMDGVKLEEWKVNVSFAIQSAASKAKQISIGGLSTGGTLSFYMSDNSTAVNGTLFLFSAALDLAGGPLGLFGEVKERLLRTFLPDVLDSQNSLIGDNPYRYNRMDLDGARELAKLIKETDALIDQYSQKYRFPKRVFAAHSEADTTADIAGIKRLKRVSVSDRFCFFPIPRTVGVSHASLVLKDPILNQGVLLEKQNPWFQKMMDAISNFACFDTVD